MAPEKSPAFQFYPKDYLSDPRVKAMSFEQRGLYWEAVSLCWLEGSLPADIAELAAILGCPKRRLEFVWPRIGLCFETHGERLTHKRLDKERAAQADSRERRADAAKKRWEKEQKTDAMHMQSTVAEQSPVDAKQCSSSASSSPTSSASSTAVNGTPPSDMQPIISGESNPRTWGKIHGDHVTGFCDWVCLPEFIFAEFCRKSGTAFHAGDGGAAYVKGWAQRVRSDHEGKPVGDNLKFWRARWDESHPVPKLDAKPKMRPMAEILAEHEAKKAGRAS